MFLPVIAAIAAAILNTFQAGANARLYKGLENPFYTALVVMASATSGIIFVMIVSYWANGASKAMRPSFGMIPWWAWCGGLFGLLYVFAMLLYADKLGSAVFSALTLSAGMITAVLLDHFGLFGFKEHPLNAWRVLGCVLLSAGAALIAKF